VASIRKKSHAGSDLELAVEKKIRLERCHPAHHGVRSHVVERVTGGQRRGVVADVLASQKLGLKAVGRHHAAEHSSRLGLGFELGLE